ncbi:hypothetical protein [Pseudogracilibacillus sp. ICA-222130]|uniref:hypothetical protein n=1 Tax=Pseudogracilibacillus sp. ICA-222130 TaxID=3134655 RepID=UPI0030C2C694
MTGQFAEALVDYSIYLIGFIALFLIFGIFAFLSKFAIFQFAGRTILYAIQIVFNIIVTGLLIVIITGVFIGLILLGSYQFDLFLVNGESLMFGDQMLVPTAAILAACCVIGGVLGSIIFSMLPLSSISFMALVYGASVFSLVAIGPIFLKEYVPAVEFSSLHLLLLSLALPVVIFVYAIASGQKRKEALREMNYKERQQYLTEERRRNEKNKGLIFSWITYRKRAQKKTS